MVLVPKVPSGQRPLSLTPVVWRLGAADLTRRASAGAEAWADACATGGLPGRRTAEAFSIQAALRYAKNAGEEAAVLAPDLENTSLQYRPQRS